MDRAVNRGEAGRSWKNLRRKLSLRFSVPGKHFEHRTRIASDYQMSDQSILNYSSVILTGGSSGIGKSFISRINRDSPQTLICNLSRRKPEVIVSNNRLRHLAVDLSNKNERRKATTAALRVISEESPSGQVLVINNAGFGHYGEFPGEGIDKQLEILEVNVAAVLEISAQCLPLLRDRGGTLLNVASITAFQPTPFIATYGATKAFLLQWGYSLNEELKDTGVNVLTVCPGSTRTAFHSTAGMKMGGAASRFDQTSDQVVDEALIALFKRRKHIVTGWSNRIMTTVSRHIPLGLATRMSGRVLAHLSKTKRGDA